MHFLDALFSSGPFMPHGYCYMWVPGLVWLHVISDSLIALAYLSIPFTLAYFVRRRTDLPFDWMFLSFGVFILACGATHAMEVWNLWHADYWVAGVVKAVTAIASLATAEACWADGEANMLPATAPRARPGPTSPAKAG